MMLPKGVMTWRRMRVRTAPNANKWNDVMNISELKLEISRLERNIDSIEKQRASLNKAIKIDRLSLDDLKHKLVRAELQEDLERKQAEGEKWQKEHPEEFARWFKEIIEQNRKGHQDGADRGWWDLDANGKPISPAKRFKISEFPKNAVMAHVMAKAGIFPSIGQARKNGHNIPIKIGEFVVTKRKIRIVIEE